MTGWCEKRPLAYGRAESVLAKSIRGATTCASNGGCKSLHAIGEVSVSSLMRDIALDRRGDCLDGRRQVQHLPNIVWWQRLVESQVMADLDSKFGRAQLLTQRVDLIAEAAHFRCGRKSNHRP